MRLSSFLFLLLTTIFASSILASEEPDYPEKKGKTIHAVFTNPQPPTIDGKLDDPIWHKINPTTDFIQTDPVEGVKPSEKTTLKIAYDKQALYVAVHAYDQSPGEIRSKLNRRDNLNNSDTIKLFFDTQHDHQTAFVFGTNPNGIQFDSFISNDGEGGWRSERGDVTWDAVWQVETKRDSTGWRAEFRIPLAMLRFPPLDQQEWGFNMQREIERKREQIWWVLKRRGDSGLVSRFGHIDQINGLRPPKRLEFLPYVNTRSSWLEDNANTSFAFGTGFDIKYGISSGVTLDATVNPDFGQVEADPEVLNLSVFETFYPEKRPFFIEGAHLFNTPFNLFHSRRIGREPGTYKLQEEDELINKPDFTTIYSAAKITGKTSGGTSFAVLDGLTSREYADVTVTDSVTGITKSDRERRLIEPLTNYFVGRITQDIWAGNSRIGAMVTSMNRQAEILQDQSRNRPANNAYSGAVDWNLWSPEGTYSFTGQTAFSARGLSDSSQNGYALETGIQKEGGRWMHGGLKLRAISPDFNINDLGFNRRSDIISLDANLRFFTVDYFWITRRIHLNFSGGLDRNYNGLNLEKRFNSRLNFVFRNYWSLGYGFNKSFDVFDDLETRGGPPTLKPGSFTYNFSFDTDRRNMVHVRFRYHHGTHRFGSKWESINFDLNIKPADNLNISIDPRFSKNTYASQWVTNVDDNDDGYDDHFIFGKLKNQILDVTLRTDFSFNRNLSVQFYMQPFLTSGDYLNYKELARPYSYEFNPYALDENYDFKISSLNSNFVLRWEYRPGSTLYFVWAHDYRKELETSQFSPGNDFKNLLSNSGNNIIMLKWNYWMNI